jgi:2-isopropylmalate synthase
MSDWIRIFDTTLRDGEQSPGASMNVDEKLRLAHQLARLRVDIIEAGFPIASEGDFEAVQAIARQVEGPMICGLSRTSEKDIQRCFEAVRDAKRPAIHTFIATSDIHMKYKLKMSRDQVLAEAKRAVTQARECVEHVEFSAEDATRSEWAFLVEVFQTALDAGANTLNVPDTVGYTTPGEYAALIEHLRANVRGIDKAVISVHCHNDLGLAVANSLMAVKAGARQVECTINGIGERAGNAALEEIVMALKTRPEVFGLETNIDATQIYHSSRLLTQVTGMLVQPNKAIVGANAFAHEAGIHQDGMLKARLTYEIMTPQSIGLDTNKLVLGKHSGRHAFRDRLKALGYELSDEQLNAAFIKFKALADKKKEIFDEDLEAVVAEELVRNTGVYRYKLVGCNVASGTDMLPTATVQVEIDGELVKGTANGDGPVDAALNAIKRITDTQATMLQYTVSSISGGTDAQGEVTVRLEREGKTALGQGAHTDIVVASAKAYTNALNKLLQRAGAKPNAQSDEASLQPQPREVGP